MERTIKNTTLKKSVIVLAVQLNVMEATKNMKCIELNLKCAVHGKMLLRSVKLEQQLLKFSFLHLKHIPISSAGDLQKCALMYIH